MGVDTNSPKKFDQLIDWMAETKVTQAAFARRVGRQRRDINRLLNGRLKFIDPKLAVAIERETAGAVTAVDFIAFMSRKEAA